MRIKRVISLISAAALSLAMNSAVQAHDPIFGVGPHVLYKGGVELATELHWDKKGNELENELGAEVVYGITGDWAAGIEVPMVVKADDGESSSGLGDVSVFTKYRFWRKDTLGAQESAALFAKIISETGDEKRNPALGTGTTDGILGLAYGYEGRKWYRFASVRYRRNGTTDTGLRRGDKILLDLVGGIRPTPTGYLEPDTVWLLELNGEYGKRAELNGNEVANTGGTEWFVSPGIFWTYRNFAIKAGIQVPIYHNLNGNQEESDYRAKMVFEWHL